MHKPEKISDFIENCLFHDKLANAAVFNTLRILKKRNPGDLYYEAYLAHWKARKNTFFDYYHLLWKMGSFQNTDLLSFDRIMEIGCRTGISICQFLSSMPDPSRPEIYLFDVFNDGFISPNLVLSNLKALNLPTEKVHFIVGDSLQTVPEKQLIGMDYVLVDGNHEKTAARADLENVIPCLAEGGILLFDDIAPDGCDLKDVWEDFKNDHAEEFFFHENYDGKGIGIGVKR